MTVSFPTHPSITRAIVVLALGATIGAAPGVASGRQVGYAANAPASLPDSTSEAASSDALPLPEPKKTQSQELADTVPLPADLAGGPAASDPASDAAPVLPRQPEARPATELTPEPRTDAVAELAPPSSTESTAAVPPAEPTPESPPTLLPPNPRRPRPGSDPTHAADAGRRNPVSMLTEAGPGARTVGALAVVLGLIFIVAHLARRWFGPMVGIRGPSGVIEVLARYPLAKGQTLVLVKVDRRILLLNQTAEATATLSEFIEPDDVASVLLKLRDDAGESFDRRLERIMQETAPRSIAPPRLVGESTADVVDLTRPPGGPWRLLARKDVGR